MSRFQRVFSVLIAGLAVFSFSAATGHATDLLDGINLPDGFKIKVFAKVPRARSLAIDPATNIVYVGSRQAQIHSVLDADGDGFAEKVELRADNLAVPNGVAIHGGHLFIALQDQLVKWRLPQTAMMTEPMDQLQTVYSGFPDRRHHGWRYAKFSPDGQLYVAIGAPCNICLTRGLEGTIVRINPDDGALLTVAHGVRNSVGFDWHPKTGQFFFTDNGADGMGDDIPPDEFNRLDHEGEHFGFPWRGGNNIRLNGFQRRQPPGLVSAPVLNFTAHAAALGVHFYRGSMFPESYRGSAFVAQHGSWNRSKKSGYRIMRIIFDAAGQVVDKVVFADGWLDGQRTLGRPVDITETADGALLVSDDYTGLIYRISYQP